MIMITSSKEVNSSSTKNEGNNSTRQDDVNDSTKVSTPCLRLKDPRIVRVSRALGGKDRHSKVSTIRGLRDRRVRLSVQTAIQLFDLQDRLGLNQPSKVVDWLLDVAKDDIDHLPPLPIPPEGFTLSPQASLRFNNSNVSSHGFGPSQSIKEGSNKMGDRGNWEDPSVNIWNSDDALLRAKSKEVSRDCNETRLVNAKESRRKMGESQKGDQLGDEENNEGQVSSGNPNFLPSTDHSSSSLSFFFIDSSNNNSNSNNNNKDSMPSYTSFFANCQSSHLGFISQNEELHNLNVVPMPSSLSLSPNYFPSHASTTSMETNNTSQFNHFQMLSSNTQNHNHHHHQSLFSHALAPISHYSLNQSNTRPFHLATTIAPRFLNSRNIASDQPTKAQKLS